uniref:Uncharacterized protein n=1 Tax=Glossina pallidipes TaxID=7398 RepID=A0A1A9ZC21_GLOPL
MLTPTTAAMRQQLALNNLIISLGQVFHNITCGLRFYVSDLFCLNVRPYLSKTNYDILKDLMSLVFRKLGHNDIDDSLLVIHNIFFDSPSPSVPVKSDFIKRSYLVWFNTQSIRVRNKECRLDKKFKRNGGIVDYIRYSNARDLPGSMNDFACHTGVQTTSRRKFARQNIE